MELLCCALTGICAVIRSNTVFTSALHHPNASFNNQNDSTHKCDANAEIFKSQIISYLLSDFDKISIKMSGL